MHCTPQDNQRQSATFSASSRNFDLNGEARTARTERSSPIIPPAWRSAPPSQIFTIFDVNQPYPKVEYL
jgi:hypothetical protein